VSGSDNDRLQMWEFLLHRFLGVGDHSQARVRLGAGVVGSTTAAVISVCAVIGGISWALSHEPLYAVVMAIVLAVILIVFLFGTWHFARSAPDQAVMGGSDWIRFREAQMSSKFNPTLPNLLAMEDPSPAEFEDSRLLDKPEIE
jgi:hypothetical protein